MNPTKAPHDFQVRGLLLLGIQHLNCTVGLEKTYEQLASQVFLRPVASLISQIHQILAFRLDAGVLQMWTPHRMRNYILPFPMRGLEGIPHFVGLTT